MNFFFQQEPCNTNLSLSDIDYHQTHNFLLNFAKVQPQTPLQKFQSINELLEQQNDEIHEFMLEPRIQAQDEQFFFPFDEFDQQSQIFKIQNQKMDQPILNRLINHKQILNDQKQSEIDPDQAIEEQLRKKLKKLIVKSRSLKNTKIGNTKNMARFFLKLVMKYFSSYGCQVEIDQSLKENLKKKKGIRMSDFAQILANGDSLHRRQIMARIIRSTFYQEIIQKKQIKDKLSYLNSTKIYALRCRSKHLIKQLRCK